MINKLCDHGNSPEDNFWFIVEEHPFKSKVLVEVSFFAVAQTFCYISFDGNSLSLVQYVLLFS